MTKVSTSVIDYTNIQAYLVTIHVGIVVLLLLLMIISMYQLASY